MLWLPHNMLLITLNEEFRFPLIPSYCIHKDKAQTAWKWKATQGILIYIMPVHLSVIQPPVFPPSPLTIIQSPKVIPHSLFVCWLS